MKKKFKDFELDSETSRILNIFKELEEEHSLHINNYGNAGVGTELEKESSRMMGELTEKRKELLKELFKTGKPDKKYDYVHDCILTEGRITQIFKKFSLFNSLFPNIN